jgi:hypothetical protein
MTKTAGLITLIVAALMSMPAHAQQRVFVSGQGLDTNPCTVTQPCRTFQHAYNTAAPNGEIDVLDPAGYGPVLINRGISIQAHGFGGITQTANCNLCAAIAIAVTTSDPVTLNGLLLDGGGTGTYGINIVGGQSVQILNSVIRHFQFGIRDITTTIGSNLLVEDTIASDNVKTGITLNPQGSGAIKATLSRITVNNSATGVYTTGNDTTIANSVISNNGEGLLADVFSVTWLAKTVISGNQFGVLQCGIGTVKSYGDNYINDNGLPVSGSLTPVGMQ